MHISIRARGLLGSRNHEHRVKVPLLHGLDLSDAIREFLENRSVEVELRTMVTESCWVGIRVDMDLFWGVHCCLGIQLHVEFCDVGVHGSLGCLITLVHKSLDISKFSNYDELCSELARMFGLEGQLEDPQRSGWQLVFVDRENDVLLLGDDPWQLLRIIG
ncbi:hypothetical protein JRO89_XS01G0201600 [Xanthoceras sorbifolium]|uniref:PB1 domain-containing protein n=1 Tax=Xanthoceras sorbifolium TaxID=99658 RepID=A0ABQ8IKW5_9ROSI|nr:hypothetical protein JRO89_XS01G0201600 [Xanthoceras sorbifolium]